MSNNGATTTQGQSIPTALFEKMFGKDNGMPGRDELLSTMQTLGSKQGECTATRQIEYITEEVRKKMEALFPGLDWTKDEDVKKVTTHLARARLAEIRRALEEGTET